MRSVYHDFLNKLSRGKRWGNPKVWKEAVSTQGSVVIRYLEDPYLREKDRWYTFLNHSNAPKSVLVAGMGLWAAAGRFAEFGRWPDAFYRQYLLEKMAELRSFQWRNPQVVVLWLGMPCVPHSTVKRIIDSRRSYDRLFHMDQFAMQMAAEAGIGTVNWFSISESMTHTSLDGTHYVTVVRDTIGNVLVSEICRRLGRL